MQRWHAEELYNGFSPYNYVLNNPVNYFDVLGLAPDSFGNDPEEDQGKKQKYDLLGNPIKEDDYIAFYAIGKEVQVTAEWVGHGGEEVEPMDPLGFLTDYGDYGGQERERGSNGNINSIPMPITPSLTATTMTAKFGFKEDYWKTQLFDKLGFSGYSGKVVGNRGKIFNKNVEFFNGEFKGVEYSVNTATSTFAVSTVNYGVSVGTNIFNAEIHVGVSLGDGITLGSSYTDTKNNITGSDVSFRPGVYSFAVGVIIWRAPQLLPLIAPYLAK